MYNRQSKAIDMLAMHERIRNVEFKCIYFGLFGLYLVAAESRKGLVEKTVVEVSREVEIKIICEYIFCYFEQEVVQTYC